MNIRAWVKYAAAKVAALRKILTGFVREYKTRIKQIGIGHAIYDTASWFFDNPGYITMIAVYGPLVGGAIMTALSLVICFVTLLVYERMKIEWTGVDVLDNLRERGIAYAHKINNHEKHKHIHQLFAHIIFFIPVNIFVLAMWLMKRYGDVAAFFVLSIFEDPFYTTAYLRHARFDGLKKKDYLIFFASVLFSNGYWIMRNTVLILIATAVWWFYCNAAWLISQLWINSGVILNLLLFFFAN